MRRLASGLYARLPTERPNPRTRQIDLKDALGLVRAINAEDARVAPAVARQARALACGVEMLADCLRGGGDVVFIGAGTSGRLGVLEAAECPPTFNTEPKRIRAVMAGGAACVFRSKEGAEDDGAAGARAAAKLRSGDCLVGIAASGVTPFVNAALRAARRRGCRTILVTSNGRPPRNPAQLTIAVSVGPEAVTGSTRMKSGTAAKLVLNTLTTGAMVLLGKVHDHWMVDLKATNRKLRLRGERMVADLGRVPAVRARALFKACGGSVKAAVLMARRRLSAAEARSVLESHGGVLRKALETKR
ncbi:MAG: N-acetylmuramic acid 6-phosphate etherase [Elusimicrobiota bacterium]